MALFNYANREITAKIVYYGPGVCGKTTSLQYIHERIAPEQRGRLLSLATETDRTIFFDLLPLKLGEIRGFKLRFQLYTVPGQVKYNKTRKLVLQGADAVVFVADSQVKCRELNIESFRNLQENLKEQGKRIEDMPLVYEFNKRDLKDLLSIEQLNQDLNPRKLPFFQTVATKGMGVMEALETISKVALHDIEQRLSATATAEKVPEPEVELGDEDLLDLTTTEELTTDLTGGELSFSSEELDSLELGSELDAVTEEEKPLESRPIGYDKGVEVEEFEIQPESVAHTGTLKESEFFNLKDVEEQALRELDEFIQGKEEEDTFAFEAYGRDTQASGGEEESGLFAAEEGGAAAGDNILDFSFGESGASSEAAENPLDFSFATGLSASDDRNEELETQDFSPPKAEDSVLDFSWDDDTRETTSDKGASEKPGQRNQEPLELSSEELNLSLGDDEAKEDPFPSFDLPDEDTRGESTPLLSEDEDLMEFTLDEDSITPSKPERAPAGKAANTDIEPLDLSDETFGLSFDEEEKSTPSPLLTGLDAAETLSSEPYDFRITDSVRFEMQHSEEISSVTPFEKHLDQLSEEIFTAEEDAPPAEFEPENSEGETEEQFQPITDESKRLIVLAKFFYQQGEIARGRKHVSARIQAILMYYTAVETALKAVAAKYETCNPTVASLKIILDSIEEETGKTIPGRKSIQDNILTLKDNIQLDCVYPDQDACDLATRICERFLSSLAQEFLSLNFAELSPVLPQPSEN